MMKKHQGSYLIPTTRAIPVLRRLGKYERKKPPGQTIRNKKIRNKIKISIIIGEGKVALLNPYTMEWNLAAMRPHRYLSTGKRIISVYD